MIELTARRLALLDEVPASVAVIDSTGTIQAINAGWRRFARENGRDDPDSDVGTSFRGFADEDGTESAAAARGIFDVIEGRAEDYALVYPCHSPDERRWFEFLVVPLRAAAPRPVLALHVRITPTFDPDGRILGMADATVQSLDGIATVCAWCRRQQRLSGSWEPLADNSPSADELLPSHGICADCLARFDESE